MNLELLEMAAHLRSPGRTISNIYAYWIQGWKGGKDEEKEGEKKEFFSLGSNVPDDFHTQFTSFSYKLGIGA